MLLHYRSKHKEVKYPCNQCDYQTTTQSSLQVHITAKHSDTVLKCDSCNYQTKWSTHYYKHKKTHVSVEWREELHPPWLCPSLQCKIYHKYNQINFQIQTLLRIYFNILNTLKPQVHVLLIWEGPYPRCWRILVGGCGWRQASPGPDCAVCSVHPSEKSNWKWILSFPFFLLVSYIKNVTFFLLNYSESLLKKELMWPSDYVL